MPWIYNPFTGKLDWTDPTPTITPGGSTSQVQFNNGGAFAGASGITTTGTELTIASGTKTTSAPIQDLSQTWNAAGVTFTGWRLNVTDTASASASLLMDLQTGGVSRFQVSKLGKLTIVGEGTGGGSYSASFCNSSGTETAWITSDGTVNGLAFSGSFVAVNTVVLNQSSQDVVLVRDAANTLAQRNGTNAQTFRLYNTFTDASNYERGKIEWASNVLRIGTEKAGTGTARALELQTDGTTRLTIGTNGAATFNGDIFVENVKSNNTIRVWGADIKLVIYGTVVCNFFSGVQAYSDNYNISFGTTTGTKIGTGTSQKLGFWNTTPIAQPTTAVAAATTAATGTGDVVAASTTFDGYTIPQVVKALRNAGLLA